MNVFVFVLAATWAVCGTMSFVMFAIDERAHKQSLQSSPQQGRLALPMSDDVVVGTRAAA